MSEFAKSGSRERRAGPSGPGHVARMLQPRTLMYTALLMTGAIAAAWPAFHNGPSTVQAAVPPAAWAEVDETNKASLSEGAANGFSRAMDDAKDFVERFAGDSSKSATVVGNEPVSKSAQKEMPTAQPDRQQNRIEALSALQDLHVQSVLRTDEHRTCMINNSLLQEGQAVGRFVVEKINRNSVIVSSGPYRFEVGVSN